MVDVSQEVTLSLGIFLVVAAVILIFAVGAVVGLLRKLLLNTVLGLALLLVINFIGSSVGIKLPITILTVLVSAIFGLAGVGVLVLLALAGVKI